LPTLSANKNQDRAPSAVEARDLLEALVAELAAAGTSAALRQQIGETLRRWAGDAGVLFLERSGESRYVCTWVSGAQAEAFDGQGRMIRWLRVNAEVLVLRERPDVVAYLTVEERNAIERLAADACVPLVVGGTLVAFVVLCQVNDLASFSKRRSMIEAYAVRAAETWQQVTRSEDLRARQDALGHSNRLGIAGQVAASVAHEVRNPLAAIRSLVQFAKDAPVTPEERESILGDVLEEVDRIDQTVTAMLQLSQPPATRRQTLNLTELVRSVFRFVRAYAHKRGVVITVEANNEPVQIHGDERELRQVITNLLLNACQACRDNGRVVAAVSAATGAEAAALIEITDNGIGISPEHLPRLFEPFFTTRPQGTGLGLPYCRDVLERHGGTIDVGSTPGEGTRVRLRLPLTEAV